MAQRRLPLPGRTPPAPPAASTHLSAQASGPAAPAAPAAQAQARHPPPRATGQRCRGPSGWPCCRRCAAWACWWAVVPGGCRLGPEHSGATGDLAPGGGDSSDPCSTGTAPMTRAWAGMCWPRCSAWPWALAWGALVGIPAGFVIGRFNFLSRMFNPLISLVAPGCRRWPGCPMARFQGRQPGGHLDHLHLLDLAHAHQHRRGRDARPRTT